MAKNIQEFLRPMENIEGKLELKTESKEKNRPGMFSLHEVLDKQKADFVIYDSEQKNGKDIYEEIKKSLERRYWWVNEYWQERGLPKEQAEIKIGDHKITVYNFNKEIKFSDEHIKETKDVLQKYENYDPELVEKKDFLLIENQQNQSLLEDEEKFPANGRNYPEWRAVGIDPRGMRQDMEHRIPGLSNFKGTLAHEIYEGKKDENLFNDWRKDFGWDYCSDYPDEWEVRKAKDSYHLIYTNKKTRELSFGMFTTEPELCLNDYTKTNMKEDICDSAVAALFNPELIKNVSLDKYKEIKSHSVKGIKERPINFTKIPSEKIKLPELSKTEFTFYKQKGPQTVRHIESV